MYSSNGSIAINGCPIRYVTCGGAVEVVTIIFPTSQASSLKTLTVKFLDPPGLISQSGVVILMRSGYSATLLESSVYTARVFAVGSNMNTSVSIGEPSYMTRSHSKGPQSRPGYYAVTTVSSHEILFSPSKTLI